MVAVDEMPFSRAVTYKLIDAGWSRVSSLSGLEVDEVDV